MKVETFLKKSYLHLEKSQKVKTDIWNQFRHFFSANSAFWRIIIEFATFLTRLKFSCIILIIQKNNNNKKKVIKITCCCCCCCFSDIGS